MRGAYYVGFINRSAGPRGQLALRIAIGLSILVAHVLAIYILGDSFQFRSVPQTSLAFVAEIIDPTPQPTLLKVPTPTLSKLDVRLDGTPTPVVEIDMTSRVGNSGMEPAQIDTSQPMQRFIAAKMDGFRGKRAAVVTFLVEVRADGSVGQIEIKASSGAQSLDEAAEAYVRRLRWKPAIAGNVPIAMKVLYSLNL